MKKIKYIFLALMITAISACEDVVELDLPTSPPVLVIDAAINWEAGTDGANQVIRLTTTAPYYDTEVPNAEGAIVKVKDTSGNTFDFIEDLGTGNYICTNFLAKLNEKYNLYISYKEEEYIAEETLHPTVPIDKVEQVENTGFLQDQLGIRVYFTDPGDKDYFYFLETSSNIEPLKSLNVFDNSFVKGNELDIDITFEDIEIGDTIDFKLFNISKQYHDFMNLLLEQTGGGGPFSGSPAGVNGNCYNQTNPEKRPLGYFRVVESRSVRFLLK